MKKVLKGLSLVILIISILAVLSIVIFNFIIITRILFWGLIVGSNQYPNTVWWREEVLYGISGIKKYYLVWQELILYIELPISIISIIYQFLYFKIIRKKLHKT